MNGVSHECSATRRREWSSWGKWEHETERHMISSMGSIQPGLILQSYSVAKAP